MADGVVLPWRSGGTAKPKAPASPNLVAPNAQVRAAVSQRTAQASRPILPTTGSTGAVLPWRASTNAATAKAQKQLNAEAHPGILGQVAHLVEATPAGLANFAGQGAKELFYSGPREIVRGIQNPTGNGGVGFRQAVAQHPIVEQTGQSLARTAGDIAHPGHFVQAYHQGNLVGKVVEDLANASIVAGLATSPVRQAAARAGAEATAARTLADQATALGIRGPALDTAAQRAAVAETAARRLAVPGRIAEAINTAGHLGAQGANLPIKPIEWAGQGLRSGLERLGAVEVGGRTLGQIAGESALGQAVTKLGEIAKARAYALEAVSGNRATIQREGTHRVEAAAYTGTKGLSEAENRASTLVSDAALADPAARAAIRQAETTVGPKAIEDLTAKINEPVKKMGLDPVAERAHTYTPDEIRLALDYYDGRLDPEAAARINRAVEAQRHINATLTPLQQQGRLTPLDPQQLGTDLLAAKTTEHPAVLARQEALASATQDVTAARSRAELEAARASNAQLKVEGSQAQAVGRIEQGGVAQTALEGRRQQAADLVQRLQDRALGERVRGDVQAAQATEAAAQRAAAIEERSAARLARQPKPEPHLAAAEEYGASRQRVLAAAEQRLNVAADEAAQARYLRSAGPGVANEPTVRAMERRVERRFNRGLGQEETAARLQQRAGAAVDEATKRLESLIAETKRHEGELGRAQAVRDAGEVKAQLIADNANDVAALTEGRAAATQEKLGRLQEQTPLADVAAREVGRTTRTAETAGAAGERYRVAQKELDKALVARNRAQRALDAEVERRWHSLDAVPSRFRYTVAAQRAADAAGRQLVAQVRSLGFGDQAATLERMLDEVPLELKGMVDAGVDPTYLPGGKDPWAIEARSRIQALKVSPGEFSLRQQKLGSELERQTLLRPTTVEGRAALAIREIDRATRNATAKQVMAERGKTAADLGIDVAANPELLAAKGAGLRNAAQQMGYEAFDPQTIFSTPSAVDASTTFIPTELKRQVGVYFAPEGAYETIMKTAFDPIRRTWKHMVLPVSGRWHVGNIVSNAVMNTIGTGSLAWVGEYKQAWKDVKAGHMGVTDIPARLFGLSADAELRDFIRRSTGRDPNLVMRFLDKSYALNTFFDDVSRVSTFRAEAKRNLARGMTATAAEDNALRTALKVSGDFGRLTEFERAYVRRAIPFYTWARHVTQFVGHLAVENPMRLVWTLNLAQLYAPDTTGPFGDSIPVAGRLVSVGNLSPLGTFQNLYLNPRGPGAGLAQSLGPELDVAAAAVFGQNLGRGGQPLRLPPGQGRLDEFGNPINTPLLGRPRDLLSYATRQVPLVNTARQLVEGRKIAEYDTGQPILKNKRMIDSTPAIVGTNVSGRLGILAGQLGVPVGTDFNVAEMAATAAKRQATAAKARERYAKQLASAKRHPAQ